MKKIFNFDYFYFHCAIKDFKKNYIDFLLLIYNSFELEIVSIERGQKLRNLFRDHHKNLIQTQLKNDVRSPRNMCMAS